MSKNIIYHECKKAEDSLSAGSVKKAIENLLSAARQTADNKSVRRLEAIRETYQYMGHYLLEGVPDPTRTDVYEGLREELLEISDLLKRGSLTQESVSPYSEALRMTEMRKMDFAEAVSAYEAVTDKIMLMSMADGNETVADKKLKEDLEARMFDMVWTSLHDKEINRQVVELARDVRHAETLAPLLVSAMTLSVLEYYDRNKITVLFDIYDSDAGDNVKARAFTGLIFALLRFPDRVKRDTALLDRFSLWKDSILEFARLRHFINEMARTRDTKRISDKIMNEVMPELMKLRPEIIKRVRDFSDRDEISSIEDNPEWEKLLHKSGLDKKMRELAESAEGGADLFMPAFSNLKNFPFFTSVSNWFLPFTTEHSLFDGHEKERDIARNILSIAADMCDSDKYSLSLALSSLPSAQKGMMTSQLDAQLSQMSEEMNTTLASKIDSGFNKEVTKNLRSLYRLFCMHRKKEHMWNPFRDPFNFLSLPVIGEIASDNDIISLISEFYFKRGYYQEALQMFEYLLNDSEDADTNAAIWEKIGYCRQQIGNQHAALEAYQKAELLKDPGIWLLKRIAAMSQACGDYEKSLEYYRRVLETDPENTGLLLNAGYAALQTGDYASASRYYYHANYLNQDNLRIQRAIAWTELMNKNYDKSLAYYDKVLKTDPSATDYLNQGHVHMLRGDYKNAVSSYRKASDGDMASFDRAMAVDRPTLESLGLDPLVADIVADMVR